MSMSMESTLAVSCRLFCVSGGKTTLLKILGGKHMVDPGMLRVLGRSAFLNTALTSSGSLAHLGGEVSLFLCIDDS